MEHKIENFCGVCDQAFETLLDAYQMKDWEMTWNEFLDEFEKELQESMKNWRKSFEEEVDE